MVHASSVTEVDIPGGWTEREISVGTRRFQLVLPADPDGMLDRFEGAQALGVTPSEHEEPELFWVQVWPAAHSMAQLVLDAEWPDETEILELGCGVGLVGLVALSCGYRVTLSDGVALAVRMAAENAERNGLHRYRSVQIDWRFPLAETYSVILGSDLLYDCNNHEPLLRVLGRMLRNEGVCWFGDPGRYHTSSFLCLARERGYDVRLRDRRGVEVEELQVGCFRLIELQKTEG